MTCYMDAASGGQTTKRASRDSKEVRKVSRTGSRIAGYRVNVIIKGNNKAHCHKESCVVIRITGDILRKRVKQPTTTTRKITRILKSRAKKLTSQQFNLLGRARKLNSNLLGHSNYQFCRGVRLLGGG